MMYVVTKNEMPEGFSLNLNTYPADKIRENYDTIQELVIEQQVGVEDVRILSMTSNEIINAPGGSNYKPNIVDFSFYEDRQYTDFDTVLHYCEMREDASRTPADGLLFKKSDNIAVVAYTKGAPVISFEDKQGNMAVILLLRPALYNHWEELFSKIFNHVKGEDIQVRVACTTYWYGKWYDSEDFKCGTIPHFLMYILTKFDAVTKFESFSIEDLSDKTKYFQSDDQYNNAVIVW